jgi:hypothetical protein
MTIEEHIYRDNWFLSVAANRQHTAKGVVWVASLIGLRGPQNEFVDPLETNCSRACGATELDAPRTLVQQIRGWIDRHTRSR